MSECLHGLFCHPLTGAPSRFGMVSYLREADLVEVIREGGGVIEDPRTPDKSGFRVCFIDPEVLVLPAKEVGDHFSIKFIEDSVNAKKLPDSLKPYRVNARSIYEDYEPLKVFLGLMTWADVPKKFSVITKSPQKSLIIEEDVSDIDEAVVLQDPNNDFRGPPKVKATNPLTKVATWINRSEKDRIAAARKTEMSHSYASSNFSISSTKGGRLPYTRKEQESIINDIIEQKAYNRLRGTQYWRECEELRRVCKGNRTWQSMKEHFRKKLVPILHTFKMDPSDKEKFKLCLNGVQVEDSATEEEDDVNHLENIHDISTDVEAEMGKIQSTPKSTLKKKNKSPAKKDDEEDIELYAEFSVKKARSPRTRKKKLDVSTEFNEDDPLSKRVRKLWSDKPYVNSSFAAETPSREVAASQKAKSDYLSIKNSKPSTSKEVFKAPQNVVSKRARSQSESSASSSDISTASSLSNRRPYSRSEEEKIVKWIAETNRFSEVRGIAMWKLMEESNVLPDRTYQSMKERFRKRILPNIFMYNINESDKAAFRAQVHGGMKKSPKKKN